MIEGWGKLNNHMIIEDYGTFQTKYMWSENRRDLDAMNHDCIDTLKMHHILEDYTRRVLC